MATPRLNALTQDIRNLRRRLSSIEKINQQNSLSFGNITLNGDTGTITLGGTIEMSDSGNITIKDGLGADLIEINQDGMVFYQVSTDVLNKFLSFKNGTEDVGTILYRINTSGGFSISDYQFKTFMPDESSRIGYNTLNISDSNGDRESFLQLSHRYTSNSFTDATLNYSLDGKFGAFSITIDDSDGNGYMRIPRRSSDPAGNSGLMYYNTTSNKFRVYEGASWVDMVT